MFEEPFRKIQCDDDEKICVEEQEKGGANVPGALRRCLEGNQSAAGAAQR
jgi:hypothetical protein